MTDGFKQEIVFYTLSEIALQLLPTVCSKGVDSFKDSGIAHYEGWKDDVIAESLN